MQLNGSVGAFRFRLQASLSQDHPQAGWPDANARQHCLRVLLHKIRNSVIGAVSQFLNFRPPDNQIYLRSAGRGNLRLLVPQLGFDFLRLASQSWVSISEPRFLIEIIGRLQALAWRHIRSHHSPPLHPISPSVFHQVALGRNFELAGLPGIRSTGLCTSRMILSYHM